MTVCTPCTVVSRSSLMSVIITFMFEPAKLQMNCASASGTSICRKFGAGRVPEEVSDNGRWTARRRPWIAGAIQALIEAHRGGYEREVRERLREIADLIARG